MAADADSDADLSFPRDSKLGDPVGDNAARVRLSDRADPRVGIRAHSGRNPTDESNRTWAAIAKSRLDLHCDRSRRDFGEFVSIRSLHNKFKTKRKYRVADEVDRRAAV